MTVRLVKPLDVHEVAVQLGMDEQTVRQLTRRGELVGFKTGKGGKTSPYRYRQSQVDAFIASREALTRSGRSA